MQARDPQHLFDSRQPRQELLQGNIVYLFRTEKTIEHFAHVLALQVVDMRRVPPWTLASVQPVVFPPRDRVSRELVARGGNL